MGWTCLWRPPAAPEATPEQTAVLVDLHWLIHQGHVLEFADGRMETAKKPAPKPVKLKPASAKPAAEGETVHESAPEIEAASPPVVEPVAPTEPEPVVPAPEVAAPAGSAPAESASVIEPENQSVSAPPAS